MSQTCEKKVASDKLVKKKSQTCERKGEKVIK